MSQQPNLYDRIAENFAHDVVEYWELEDLLEMHDKAMLEKQLRERITGLLQERHKGDKKHQETLEEVLADALSAFEDEKHIPQHSEESPVQQKFWKLLGEAQMARATITASRRIVDKLDEYLARVEDIEEPPEEKHYRALRRDLEERFDKVEKNRQGFCDQATISSRLYETFRESLAQFLQSAVPGRFSDDAEASLFIDQHGICNSDDIGVVQYIDGCAKRFADPDKCPESKAPAKAAEETFDRRLIRALASHIAGFLTMKENHALAKHHAISTAEAFAQALCDTMPLEGNKPPERELRTAIYRFHEQNADFQNALAHVQFGTVIDALAHAAYNTYRTASVKRNPTRRKDDDGPGMSMA